MATYSNQHWLLAHIRNSFISTDETGMCETVMASDDMPKHFLKKFQNHPNNNNNTTAAQQQRRSMGNSGQQNKDVPLQEVDFVCYPGLDLSDDEDLDMTTQSFDIQMYPEVGAHRFRSNTAQKLEKMDIARRKAARTKNVNVDDIIVPPESSDFFVKKPVPAVLHQDNENVNSENVDKPQKPMKEIKSKLSEQLANSPNQVQNKFIEFARFDGTSQVGIQTKRINVFLNMLPERERNYPMKICVISNAKIIEVIGLVCYKATIQFPDLPLKSIRHYALYMTEDNDDMEDFPPLDNREPCSKFGFSHLTLAERRPLAPVTRLDYDNNKSMTSEEEKSRLAAEALRSLQNIELNAGGGGSQTDNQNSATQLTSDDHHMNAYEKRMLSHNDILEAPMYRTYRLNFIDKRFFRTEVTLGISGDLLEIDQPKNAKFWIKQRQVSYAIDSVAFCEIVERRNLKSTLRIWLKAASSLTSGVSMSCAGSGDKNSSTISIGSAHSPTGPGYYNAHHTSSPFAFLGGGGGGGSSSNNTPSGNTQQQIRFKHYDFETDIQTAEQILNKLNCILESRASDVRAEFKQMRERKLGKNQAKKHLKL